uniref:Uncharacterized protein n=1 Tax=Romanomermis culicivorax TaxID=13658 RepID=A0A915LDW7_ROMCU
MQTDISINMTICPKSPFPIESGFSDFLRLRSVEKDKLQFTILIFDTINLLTIQLAVRSVYSVKNRRRGAGITVQLEP